MTKQSWFESSNILGWLAVALMAVTLVLVCVDDTRAALGSSLASNLLMALSSIVKRHEMGQRK